MAVRDSMRWSVSSEMEDDSACAVGRIHGLKARADLNGKAARAVKFIQSKGRWALVVDGGEKVLVKVNSQFFSAVTAAGHFAVFFCWTGCWLFAVSCSFLPAA